MNKSKVSFFVLLIILFLSLSNYANLAYALKSEDTPEKSDFFADTLYTDPIDLEIIDEEQQIEIIIARWGSNEEASEFELSIKSTPTFMKNVKWKKGGTKIEFKPDETEKTVVLSFQTQAAQGSKNQDLVLLIKSDDEDLVPKVRKIVLPFNGPEKSVESINSIIICPYDSDKEEDDDTDKICEKNIPVHAEDDYKVLVDPGLGWDTPFELRIVNPEKKIVDRVINNIQYLEQIKRTDELYPRIVKTENEKYPLKFLFNIVSNLKEGIYTIETRTKMVEVKKDNTGLLGTSYSIPSFEGAWQTVGTYKILPKSVDKGPSIEMVLAEVRVYDNDNKEVVSEKNVSGHFLRKEYKAKNNIYGKAYHVQKLYSVKLTDYPTSIIMGKPFNVGAEVQFKGRYEGGQTYDCNSQKYLKKGYRTKGSIDISPGAYVEGTEQLRPNCKDSRESKQDFVSNSKASLNVHYEPVEWFERTDSSGQLRGISTYNISASGSSESRLDSSTTVADGTPFQRKRQIVTFQFAPASTPEGKYNTFVDGGGSDHHPDNQLIISFGFLEAIYSDVKITLVYKPKSVVANPIKKLSGYLHPALNDLDNNNEKDTPAEKNSDKIDDHTDAGKPSIKEKKYPTGDVDVDLQTKDDNIDQSISNTKVNGSDQNSTGIKDTNPNQPHSIDPNHPNVAAIIKEWISVAEPPSNATHGNNFHYSNMGVAIGQGKGFIAKSLHESGVFDPGFLWRNKQDLDSVNHCTLGEYVIARLKGASIDYCRGRYQAQKTDKQPPKGTLMVPNLIGKPAKDAKKSLSDKGFKTVLHAGKAAPSPQKAFTVTNMEPEPGALLKKGATIKITVFVDYAQQIKIPAISGLSTVKAKKKLTDAGFKVKIKTKGNSPSPDNAFKTIGTNPSANTSAAKGSTITLISFGPYKDQVTMPSLVGLKFYKAETMLEKLGLEPSSFPDKPAPKKEMEDIITSQEPEAGEIVSPRSRIVLNYYDDYKWKGLMPDLSGLTVARAKEKMKETGIDVRVLPGIPSPSVRLVNKIYKQSLAKNSAVKQGDALLVTIYGKTKDQYVAAKNCKGLPGTEPFWNTKTGKPGCRCKDGYLIRSDKSGCDKKVKSVPPPVIVKKKIETPPIQPEKHPGGAVALSSDACNRIKKPEFKLDPAAYNKSTDEIKTVIKKLFIPVFTSILGMREQDPWSMLVECSPYQYKRGKVNVIYVQVSYKTIPKDRNSYEYIKLIFYFNDTVPEAVKYAVGISRKDAMRSKKEVRTFDGLPVYADASGNLTLVHQDKRMLTVVMGANKKNDWSLARKVHEQLKTRGLYDIRSKLSCGDIRQYPPPVSSKKNNSTCEQYYRKLNQLIGQQQQLSSELMSNPGNTSDYACKALKLARETILMAKKARANGCEIDGNIEESSKLLMQTYQQMCKGGTVKTHNGDSVTKTRKKSHKEVPYLDFPSTFVGDKFEGAKVEYKFLPVRGNRFYRPANGFQLDNKGYRRAFFDYGVGSLLGARWSENNDSGGNEYFCKPGVKKVVVDRTKYRIYITVTDGIHRAQAFATFVSDSAASRRRMNNSEQEMIRAAEKLFNQVYPYARKCR